MHNDVFVGSRGYRNSARYYQEGDCLMFESLPHIYTFSSFYFSGNRISYNEEVSLNLTTSLPEAMSVEFLNFHFTLKDF